MPPKISNAEFQSFFSEKYSLFSSGSSLIKLEILAIIEDGGKELLRASKMSEVSHLIDKMVAKIFLCLFLEETTVPQAASFKNQLSFEINQQKDLVRALVDGDIWGKVRTAVSQQAKAVDTAQRQEMVASSVMTVTDLKERAVAVPLLKLLFPDFDSLLIYTIDTSNPALCPNSDEFMVIPASMQAGEGWQDLQQTIVELLANKKICFPTAIDASPFGQTLASSSEKTIPSAIIEWQRKLTQQYASLTLSQEVEPLAGKGVRDVFISYCQKNQGRQEHFACFLLLALLASHPERIDLLMPYIASSISDREQLSFYLNLLNVTTILTTVQLDTESLKKWILPALTLAKDLSFMASSANYASTEAAGHTETTCSTMLSRSPVWHEHTTTATQTALEQAHNIHAILGLVGVIESATYLNPDAQYEDYFTRSQWQEMRKAARARLYVLADAEFKQTSLKKTSFDYKEQRLAEIAQKCKLIMMAREAVTTKIQHSTYFRSATTRTAKLLDGLHRQLLDEAKLLSGSNQNKIENIG